MKIAFPGMPLKWEYKTNNTAAALGFLALVVVISVAYLAALGYLGLWTINSWQVFAGYTATHVPLLVMMALVFIMRRFAYFIVPATAVTYLLLTYVMV